MRRLSLMLALISCLAGACRDIAVPEGRQERAESKNTNVLSYPFPRTLTDSQNRQMEALVLGKEGAVLAVERQSDRERYLIPLEKLGPFEQTFFKDLPDGGSFHQVKAQAEKAARLAGRTAKWQNDLEMAKREAAQYQVPLLVTVLVPGQPLSDELEKRFVYWSSEEFSAWASQNVALALVRTDDPLGVRTTTHMNPEIRRQLGELGINPSGPSVSLISGGRAVAIDPRSMMDPKSAIASVKAVMPGF